MEVTAKWYSFFFFPWASFGGGRNVWTWIVVNCIVFKLYLNETVTKKIIIDNFLFLLLSFLLLLLPPSFFPLYVEDQTQYLTLVRQALYHWVISPNPIAIFIFWIKKYIYKDFESGKNWRSKVRKLSGPCFHCTALIVVKILCCSNKSHVFY
jgi:hypothetical protein